MANYTPNLNLEKPLQSEDYDVDVFNRNCDKIDTFAGSVPARALTADKLTTGAKINGVNFKGDTDITLPVATTSVAGTVNPDGETILVNSGVISVNEDKIDGAWVQSYSKVASNVAFSKSAENKSYDLSAYLPNDNNVYEVIFSISGQTASASGASFAFGIITDKTSAGTTDDVWICSAITRTSSYAMGAGACVLPLKSRTIYVRQASTTSAGAPTLNSLNVHGYRKVK